MLHKLSLNELKILLVDDDPLILNLITRYLNNLGTTLITTANNGSEGLVKLGSENSKYDIIL